VGPVWLYRKQIEINYETQFPINSMLNDKIKYKKNPKNKQLESTRVNLPNPQGWNPSYATKITLKKANQNKLRNSISNQLNVEEWNWKK